MTKQEAIQEQIDEIMDTFDFDKVHDVMKFLDWRWQRAEEPPDIYEIKQEARERLKQAAKSGGSSTGGFTAYKTESVDEKTGEPFVHLELFFGFQSVNDGTSYEE